MFLLFAHYFEVLLHRDSSIIRFSLCWQQTSVRFTASPRSPWRPSRKDSGLIKSWFVLHLANFLSGYRLKPLNRPTAEVPPICRVYSASVRRSSRDGRLGKDRRQEGKTEEEGVERNGTIAVGTQRTFELILESIERHERLLSRDYPKSPRLPDFLNFSQGFFINTICRRLG